MPQSVRAQRGPRRGDRALALARVGLVWPGYGGRHTEAHPTEVAPGQTLDLRLTLPAPVCADTTAAAQGELELADGTVLRAPLDVSGQRFLRRVWSRACAEEYVAERVALDYGRHWHRRGAGSHLRLHGTVRLTRLGTPARVRLVDLRGSVLIQARLRRPAVLTPGAPAAAFPLVLTPARCDEHALGQSTQTFLFRATVRIGRAGPATVVATPDRRTRRQALAFLFDACRARAAR